MSGGGPPRHPLATTASQRQFTREDLFRMAEHGTRTMYVHYGCRCEACCRAEHQQYLKRKDSQARKRVRSKWGDEDLKIYLSTSRRLETQRAYNARRYNAMTTRESTHARPIAWKEIAEIFGMKCAICGLEVDPSDTWIANNGRRCYGRKYPTVDHVVPLKHGGTDTLDNVQLLCKHCNSMKGARVNAAG